MNGGICCNGLVPGSRRTGARGNSGAKTYGCRFCEDHIKLHDRTNQIIIIDICPLPERNLCLPNAQICKRGIPFAVKVDPR
jgi:hypothetical protein